MRLSQRPCHTPLLPRRRTGHRRAFTLLEIIVVLVILGILAALAIPTFGGVIFKSKHAVLLQNAEAVYTEAQALTALGVSAAGPVDESLTAAASDSLSRAAAAGTSGLVQPTSNGVVIWAQNGTATSNGTIEAYDSSWQMCVAISVPPTGALPTEVPCSLTGAHLMQITGPSGVIIGSGAPYVPGGTGYTWTPTGGGSGLAGGAPYVPIASTPVPGEPSPVLLGPPAYVTVATPDGPVVIPGGAQGAAALTLNAGLPSSSVTTSFDGSGNTYSAAALGLSPGQGITAAGFSFIWPNVAAGFPDNYLAAGQTIPVSLPAGTSSIGVLGAAANGTASGTVTINYTDNTTSTAPLALGDWATGPLPGATTAATASYRNTPGGTQTLTTYVYATSLPVDASKTVASVTLPSSVTGGSLHVFALAGNKGGVTTPVDPQSAYNDLGVGAVPLSATGELVDVSWSLSGATTSGNYHLYRCSSAGCSPLSTSVLATTSGLTYLDTTVSADTTYSYEVTATDGAGTVLVSNIATVAVPQHQVPWLTVIANSADARGPSTPGPALASKFWDVGGLAVGPNGDLYIADAADNVIEQLSPSGQLSVVAGTIGQAGYPLNGGQFSIAASQALLSTPEDVAFGPHGSMYIADTGNCVIEKVSPGGVLSVIAGKAYNDTQLCAPYYAMAKYATPGPATNSNIYNPEGIAVDSAGNVYVGTQAGQVLKITPAGILSIYAGNGQCNSISGAVIPQAGPATSTAICSPFGLAVGPNGDLYIADALDYALLEVTPSGNLSVVAIHQYLSSVGVDAAGNVYYTSANNVVEELSPAGTTTAVAGNGSYAPVVDGPALSSPTIGQGTLAVAPSGSALYFATASQIAEVTQP